VIEVWLTVGGVLLLALVVLMLRRRRRPSVAEVRRAFQQQREHLEADFFRLASATGKPRGLRWVECRWEELLEFGRDRHTGQLAALAGVIVQFEAIPGSDMEGLPAVGNLRNGSGLFLHDGRRWAATGRVVFNLNPDEVLAQFPQQFERVESV
jgi:LPXTG-motif cell wall-anchored protein